MGLVLERGARFWKRCFSQFFLTPPPPLGAPAAVFKDQRQKGPPKQHPGPERGPKRLEAEIQYVKQ